MAISAGSRPRDRGSVGQEAGGVRPDPAALGDPFVGSKALWLVSSVIGHPVLGVEPGSDMASSECSPTASAYATASGPPDLLVGHLAEFRFEALPVDGSAALLDDDPGLFTRLDALVELVEKVHGVKLSIVVRGRDELITKRLGADRSDNDRCGLENQ